MDVDPRQFLDVENEYKRPLGTTYEVDDERVDKSLCGCLVENPRKRKRVWCQFVS